MGARYSSKVQQLLCLQCSVCRCSPERFELVPEAVQGRPGDIGGDVGVDLHRYGDLAVSQDLHGDAGVDLQGGQQRPVGMAGPMDGSGCCRGHVILVPV